MGLTVADVAKTPDDPIENFADFLGAYLIVLNGTVIEKEIRTYTIDHRQDVIEKFKKLWNHRPPSEGLVKLEEKEVLRFIESFWPNQPNFTRQDYKNQLAKAICKTFGQPRALSLKEIENIITKYWLMGTCTQAGISHGKKCAQAIFEASK